MHMSFIQCSACQGASKSGMGAIFNAMALENPMTDRPYLLVGDNLNVIDGGAAGGLNMIPGKGMHNEINGFGEFYNHLLQFLCTLPTYA